MKSSLIWQHPDGETRTALYYDAYRIDWGEEPPPDLDLHEYGLRRIQELADVKAPGLDDYLFTPLGNPVFQDGQLSVGQVLIASIKAREAWRKACGL